QAVERDRRRRDQVEPLGDDGDVVRRDDQLLGVGAVVAVETGDQPRDAAAGREVRARPGGGDGAGEVPAQAGVLGLTDQPHPVEDPAASARSTGFTAAPATATRTCPGPGSATGTSMISMESGPPGVRTTALRKAAVREVAVREVVDMTASLWRSLCLFHHTGGVTLQ